MNFEIPEELKQLKNLVRQFVENELLPVEKLVEERGEFPDDIKLKLKAKALKLGLWNYAIPEKLGGGGVGVLGEALVHEELGRVSVAVGASGGVIGSGGTIGYVASLWEYATDEQRKKYLVPMIRDGKEMFFALTERNAGSDAGAIETTAVRKGDNYILNGAKIFITRVDAADYGEVYAVTDWEKRGRGGVSAFIVEKGAPGFTIGRNIPMMGRRGMRSYELNFNNCVVPAENLVGKEGEGLNDATKRLARIRIGASGCLCGTAQRALDMGADYARKRVTFGKPLIERQFVQGMLVDTFTDIYATRMMLYHLAWRMDQGEDPRVETALLKVQATEMAFRVVDRAMQIHGGVGYTKDLPLEMLFRDVRLYRIGDGPSEVLKWYAARGLFRKG